MKNSKNLHILMFFKFSNEITIYKSQNTPTINKTNMYVKYVNSSSFVQVINFPQYFLASEKGRFKSQFGLF